MKIRKDIVVDGSYEYKVYSIANHKSIILNRTYIKKDLTEYAKNTDGIIKFFHNHSYGIINIEVLYKFQEKGISLINSNLVREYYEILKED